MKNILTFHNSYTWMIRLSFVFGLFLSIGSFIFMVANKDIVPFMDMIWVIYFLLKGVGETPPVWLSPEVFNFVDNEHRPVLPMIIWGLDFKFFDSYGLLPQLLILIFAILTAVFVTGWSKLRCCPPSMTSLAITICASALMLSPLHYENLVFPKQIHVYTSVLFSVLALSAAVLIPKRSRSHQVGQALLCSFLGFCATFSFGYGLVVWPVLLIHGVLSRWPWKGYLTILIGSIGTIALYYTHYTILPTHSDPIASLSNPKALINYASLLIGGVFVGAGLDVSLGRILGYIMLAVLTYASFQVYVRRRIIDDQHIRSLLICLYCLGVGLLTALGRVTVNSGVDSRYQIIPTLYILAIPGLFQIRPPIQALGQKVALAAFLFSTLGLSASSYVFNLEALQWRQFLIREGAIATAFDTKPLHRGLYPTTHPINDYVWPYFIQHHGHTSPLNVFNWLGQIFPPPALSSQSTASEPQCIGYVDSFVNREGDIEFDIPKGWARLGPNSERNAHWIIITDSSGVVVGLATTGIKRPDVEKVLNASWIDRLLTETNRAGFIGLVRSHPGDELDFFAYKDGEVCQFARNIKVPKA